MDDGAPRARPEVWRPGIDGMEEDEELEYDPTVYDCLHAWQLEWPCLSFDVLQDELGDNRTHFPHSLFAVAGTQAEKANQNNLTLMRVTRLKKTRRKERTGNDEDSEDSDEDSDDESVGGPGGDGPVLQVAKVMHHGAVNRVRSMPQAPSIIASWGETGVVQVWDLSPQLQQLMAMTADEGGAGGAGGAGKAVESQRVAPRHAFTGHRDEGYAVDWSAVVPGRLVTGDNASGIHVWEPVEGGKWAVDKNAPFIGHQSSVEDCQWSPAEKDVFASCSADQTVCIWDCRTRNKPALQVKVHDSDVNVMSWNRMANCMLATGADDGSLRIWDLRNFSGTGVGGATSTKFVANFTFHRGPVTSVEWARFDSAMLATGSADHTVCVWDLAVERDAEEEAAAMAAEDNAVAPEDLPPQLMFVHQGLKDPKEIHWHHQIPGMCLTTAADGFNAFKAYNVGNDVA